MSRRLLACGFAMGLACAVGQAAPPQARDDGGLELRSILREDLTGSTDRRERLRTLRKTSSRLARWASGFVEREGEWIPFEEFRLPQSQATIRAEYQARRSALDGSAEGHLALAKWCRSHELYAQEYAHTLAAVMLSPEVDHRERFVKLGYRQFGGLWISPEQLADWKAEAALDQESLGMWGERLSKVAEQLAAGGRRERAALGTIDQLRDVTAVPAIARILCGQGERSALLGVERLKHIAAHQSTLALAGQAVFNKWPAVRAAAMDHLKDRKYDDYVPELLSVMQILDTSPTRSVDVLGGKISYQFLVACETSDAKFVDTEGVAVQFFTRRLGNGLYELLDARSPRELGEDLRAVATIVDIDRAVADEQFRRGKALEQFQARTTDLNQRVTAVLASVTGESRETPRDWWDWWDDYNQYEKKPKVQRVRTRQTYAEYFVPSFFRASCLAAGTPVHTDEGPKPVETLQIGDLVLTQDVESGELTYLPVLQTTSRTPTTVFRLTWNSESLVATGGHRFWVPGEGWRRVNDLKPGSLLHTATGSVAVTAIEPVPDAAVYNVVISPTHNYFVGEQALLTHDVTLPRSTNRKVPGLVEP